MCSTRHKLCHITALSNMNQTVLQVELPLRCTHETLESLVYFWKCNWTSLKLFYIHCIFLSKKWYCRLCSHKEENLLCTCVSGRETNCDWKSSLEVEERGITKTAFWLNKERFFNRVSLYTTLSDSFTWIRRHPDLHLKLWWH